MFFLIKVNERNIKDKVNDKDSLNAKKVFSKMFMYTMGSDRGN